MMKEVNVQCFVSENTGACSATAHMSRPTPGTANSSLNKGIIA